MDVGLLEQIVALMTTHDLNTVDVRDGDRRVILKRGAVVMTAAPAPVSHHPAAHHAPGPVSASSHHAPPVVDEDAGLIPIKSPMVGTFYARPSPDSKPFVQVGSVIDEETDVCSIEAMKNFMPIKAGVRGTIAKVLIADGQTVQYDTPLFLVKP
jgi:acetyl-CoA carboxylase biotin carboxyl carrier protein